MDNLPAINKLCEENCFMAPYNSDDYYCVPKYCQKLFDIAKEAGYDPQQLGLEGGC